LPLPASLISLLIQLTGIVLIGGTLFFVKKISEQLSVDGTGRGRESSRCSIDDGSPRPVLAPFLAVLNTAFYLPLNNWTLRGMEVGLLTLGTSLAVWAVLRCQAGKNYQWWLILLLGLLATVRMDAVIIGAILLIAMVWIVPQNRWRTLTVGVACLALFVLSQLVVQKTYYHDWLPNTYYLKLAGVPLTRRIVWGLYVLFHFLTGIGLWLLLPMTLYVLVARSKTVWPVRSGNGCFCRHHQNYPNMRR